MFWPQTPHAVSDRLAFSNCLKQWRDTRTAFDFSNFDKHRSFLRARPRSSFLWVRSHLYNKGSREWFFLRIGGGLATLISVY